MAFVARVLVLVAIALCLQNVRGAKRWQSLLDDENVEVESKEIPENAQELGARLPEWINKMQPSQDVPRQTTVLTALNCREALQNVVDDLKQVKNLLTEYGSTTVNLSREFLGCIRSEMGFFTCLSEVVNVHLHFYKVLNDSMGETLKYLIRATKELAGCPFQ